MPNVAVDTFNPVKASRYLIVAFLAWKSLLFILVSFCPGPGYDTSALVLSDPSSLRHANFQSSSLAERLSLNLFRWDALYFIRAARYDYVNEQDWAFSWVYSLIVRTVRQYIASGSDDSFSYYIWAGVAISNISHLFSVLGLFRLLNVILGPQQDVKVPFIASALHILSPAGLFLTAPYAEALFSMLNIGGMLHYALAKTGAEATNSWSVKQDAYILSAGVQFTAATLLRSNGLLSGSILLYDVASRLPRILAMQLNIHEVRRIGVMCAAGMLIALGFLWPQYLAYTEFCASDYSSSKRRPWCDKTFPSIYSWVQSHYWNVGFLRYWTLGNLPLFLMASPMLWLLVRSSVEHLRDANVQLANKPYAPHTGGTGGSEGRASVVCSFPEIAIPQLVLAILAMTSFHVQIINRLSSGYPIWYLVVAKGLVQEQNTLPKGKSYKLTQSIVRSIVMYALVQGVLFANFLPPA